MKKFDENYELLEEMANDSYFPKQLVEGIKELIWDVIRLLESGESSATAIQKALDEMTLAINDMQEEFEKNDSEIETVARDSIAVTVEYILSWFGVDIDIETALAQRDW